MPIQIRLYNQTVSISTPYSDGTRAVTEVELAVLDRLRADRVRDIAARRAANNPDAPIRELVAHYDREFSFAERSPRKGPLEVLLDEVAQQAALAALRSRGQLSPTLREVEQEAQVQRRTPEALAEARRQLAVRKASTEELLENLS